MRSASDVSAAQPTSARAPFTRASRASPAPATSAAAGVAAAGEGLALDAVPVAVGVPPDTDEPAAGEEVPALEGAPLLVAAAGAPVVVSADADPAAEVALRAADGDVVDSSDGT